MQLNKKTSLLLIGSLFISCILLFFNNPFYGHDIGFHLSRIQSISDSLKNNVFPAIIYPNYFSGYGYANGIFYPDLFLYIPGIMVYLGIECKTAYNVFLLIINIATLVSMYYCSYSICKNTTISSLVSCIYLLSSYRITDLYTRSALGETLSFIFVPFVLLGIYEILYNNYKNGHYLIIGLFGVLSSHIISIVFCVVLIALVYCLRLFRLFSNKKEFLNRSKYLILCCFASVLLCAYFIFPFIESLSSDKFFFQTAPATGGCDRTIPLLRSIIELPISYRTTYYPLGIGLSFVVIIYLFIRHKKSNNSFYIDMFVLGLLFWLMTTDLFPWRFLEGFAKIIQFPWRFMILATACLLFSSLEVLSSLMKTNKKRVIFVSLVCSIAYSVLCSAIDIYIIYDFKLYNDDIHYSVGGAEYLPEGVDVKQLYDRGLIVTSNNSIKYDFYKTGTSIELTYSNNNYDDTYLELPLIYYKGYKAFENNTRIDVQKGNNGVIRLNLHNQDAKIKLYYGFTVIRIIGYLTTLLILIFLVLYRLKKIYY